jgi:hypothetical protein
LDREELAHVYRDILGVVLKKMDLDEDSKEYIEEEVPEFAEGAAEASFKRIDKDGSGTLSVSEFKNFVLGGDFVEILSFGSD